jgi:hypothetical protein
MEYLVLKRVAATLGLVKGSVDGVDGVDGVDLVDLVGLVDSNFS